MSEAEHRAENQAAENGAPAEAPRPAPHNPHHGIGFMGRLRAYFLAGALVAAPIAVTTYLGWWFITFIDGNIRPLIPAAYNPENYLPFSIPGIGVLTMILALTLIGAFAAGYVGRLALRFGEGVVARMPVVSSVYAAVKQIVETVLAQKSGAFREVVMIEYPRRGLWSLGFVTGPAHPEMRKQAGEDDMVFVFIPCAPPTAGYLVATRRDEIRHVDMPVDEGFKLIVSCGIVNSAGREAGKPATLNAGALNSETPGPETPNPETPAPGTPNAEQAGVSAPLSPEPAPAPRSPAG